MIAELRRPIQISLIGACISRTACDASGKFGLSPKPTLKLWYQGQQAPGLILDHEFQIKIWHQHQGTIKNGTVSIKVWGIHLKGKPRTGRNQSEWSFDTWAPDKSEARNFAYLLDAVGEDFDLVFEFEITSADTRPLKFTVRWGQDG